MKSFSASRTINFLLLQKLLFLFTNISLNKPGIAQAKIMLFYASPVYFILKQVHYILCNSMHVESS